MLSIFRTNQLLVSALLLVFIAVLRAYPFFFPIEWEAPKYGLLSAHIYQMTSQISWIAFLSASILVFLQGIIVNGMASFHRLDKEVTMIPGLVYVTLCSIIPEFLVLSPMLIANTFLLIAILELLQTYKKTACNDRIFNAGFWLAIASLCYVPYLGFALGMIIGLGILRPFKIGERIVFLGGIIVPYFLTGVAFFWLGDLHAFWDIQFGAVGEIKFFPLVLSLSAGLKVLLFVILIVLAVISYGVYSAKKNIDVQKKIDIFYWIMLSSLLIFAFHQAFYLEQLLALVIPLGVFISLNLTAIASRWAETWYFFMILLALLMQYYPYLV